MRTPPVHEPAAPPWGVPISGNRWDRLDGAEPETWPTISVIVVHFDQQKELDRTLLALQRQQYPTPNWEVIVVDDGSPRLPRIPPGVRLLAQSDQGFRASRARNLGAAAASGDILCFLDADTVPEPDYLRAMARLPALSPEVVTVGRRLHAELDGLDPGGRIELDGPANALPDPTWLREEYRRSDNLLHADDRSYRFLIGAVLACSRWFFEDVGGFDETFDEYGGEDWEWAYRCWLAGAVFAHVPNAVAWHHGPDFAQREMADVSRRESAQREALRLAELIPAPGSRGRGLRYFHPDILIRLDESISAAAGVVCVDAFLTQLPDAVVQVSSQVAHLCPEDNRIIRRSETDKDTERLSRVRVLIEVAKPSVPLHGVLSLLCGRLVDEDLHRITVVDRNGSELFRMEQTRTRRRQQRWSGRKLFPDLDLRLDEGAVVDDQVSFAAYFGQW